MTNSQIVSIFNSHSQAEAAVKALQESDIDIKDVSIVGKGYHSEEKVAGFYNTGDRMKTWGKFGLFWGGLWGVLFGSAFFMLPGIGPIAVAGPLVATIVSGIEGAAVVGGLSALGAGLVSLGIPKDSVIKYESSLKADNFLLVYGGNQAEKVREILKPLSTDTVLHNS